MYKLIRKVLLISLPLAIIIGIVACSGGKLNFFGINQDIKLGLQVSREIERNPRKYPILSEEDNQEVYSYVRGIVQQILDGGKIKYRDEFAWEVKIIEGDNTLNAFATPGGYIYLYTGLIKFLDSEDQLAGVIGHEMAHADLRHSTRQLSQSYGFAFLLGMVSNSDPSSVERIAAGLLQLKFGRNQEREADSYSVNYLCNTDYNAAGAAGFFVKMQEQPRPPDFLSTHPNPGNRVENIKKQATENVCQGQQTNRSSYQRIKRLLE